MHSYRPNSSHRVAAITWNEISTGGPTACESFSEGAHPFPHISTISYISSCSMGKKLQENTKHGRISAPRYEHTYTPSPILSWMISRAQQRKTLHVQVIYNSARALYGDQNTWILIALPQVQLCINLLLN